MHTRLLSKVWRRVPSLIMAVVFFTMPLIDLQAEANDVGRDWTTPRGTIISDVPDSLNVFLSCFVAGYSDNFGGVEYNCDNATDGTSNMVWNLISFDGCVPYYIYPYDALESVWDDDDPRGWSAPNNYYNKISVLAIDWICNNIFNINSEAVQTLTEQGEYSEEDYKRFYVDGGYYYWTHYTYGEGPLLRIKYEDILYDGLYYYIAYSTYDCYDNTYVSSFYTVVQEKTIGGKNYWSMCYHSSVKPLFLNGARFIYPVSYADDSAIPISTAEQLASIESNLSGNYALMNDIDVSAYQNGVVNIRGVFNGTLNGNGYVIHGAKIHGFGDVTGACLFQTVGVMGVVKNLGIEACSVYSPYSDGFNSLLYGHNDAVAGTICETNTGLVENCFVRGNIGKKSEPAPFSRIGGVCGVNHGRIINCYFDGSIHIEYSRAFYTVLTGGIVAENTGEITTCFANGEINATGFSVECAGITAINAGSIRNCLNYSNIYARTNYTDSHDNKARAGGIISSADGGSCIKCCLNAGNVTGLQEAGGIAARQDYGEISRCAVLSKQIAVEDNYGIPYAAIISTCADYYEDGRTIIMDNNLAVTTVDLKGGRTYRNATKLITPEESNSSLPYEELGWDFKTIWMITNSCPELRMENTHNSEVIEIVIDNTSIILDVYFNGTASGASVWCAQYDSNDQFLCVGMQDLEIGINSSLFFQPLEEGSSVKVFILDDQFVPLCDSVKAPFTL